MAEPVDYAANVRPRLRVPATAAPGAVIEVRTLISHPMESGHRITAEGRAIPRLIIQRVEAHFNGSLVFAADWGSGVAANPYQSFMLKVAEAGMLEVTEDTERQFGVPPRRRCPIRQGHAFGLPPGRCRLRPGRL